MNKNPFSNSRINKTTIKRRTLNSSVKVAAYYYSPIIFIAREKVSWFSPPTHMSVRLISK